MDMTPELLNTRTRRSTHGKQLAATIKYSKDGKYLFQREAHVIRVLNTKNGQLLHECIRAEAVSVRNPAVASPSNNSDNHVSETAETKKQVKSEVTAIALHPHNALQLIAAYDDGKILVWDIIEEKILQEFDAKAPILWLESSTTSPSILMAVISTVSKPSGAANEKENGSETDDTVNDVDDNALISSWALIEFNLKKKRRGRTLLQQNKLSFQCAVMQSYTEPTTDNNTSPSITPIQGDYVVVAAGARLFAIKLCREQDGGSAAAQGRPFTTQKLTHSCDVKCVAIHPNATEFSIGDTIGQLFRFHGQQGTTSTAKMHWHAHAVTCVAYSSDGNFLVSGGEECVFVSWHLESGRRAYLPRRSAPLTAIATRADGAGYAIALKDHMLFQYNHITKEEEWHTLGLARSGEDAKLTLPSRQIVFDPISSAIPLNGISSAGVLQFYEPYKDRVLQSVLLTERNQVTRTEDEEIPQIVAEQLHFSPNGMELVTVHSNILTQVADQTKKGDEQSLRFWKRREDGSFYVNTAVDAPHGSSPVTCMTFSPSMYNDCVVTGDADGEFKVWKKSAEALTWHCQSVVKFREEPITAMAFADDGSLLAVAYNHLLTLWEVGTNALRNVIPSADGTSIQQITFTGKTSPYVVLKTQKQVQVWNLLNYTLWWRYEVLEESFVSGNAVKEQFLVWMKHDKHQYLILVFQPDSPVPLVLHTVNVGAQDVWSVHFHPKNGDLVILDGQSNVWRLGEKSLIDKNRRKDTPESEAPNVFNALYKHAATTLTTNKSANKFGQKQTSGSSGLFEAPAHVLPSMTALYRSFMDTMLPKPNAQVKTQNDDEESGVTVDGGNTSKQQKKKNKKRKKQQQQSQQQNDGNVRVDSTTAEEADESQKRMKRIAEQELANPALQQQTYSKLLEAFRKDKQQKATSIK